jgi:hypothetical protein
MKKAVFTTDIHPYFDVGSGMKKFSDPDLGSGMKNRLDPDPG